MQERPPVEGPSRSGTVDVVCQTVQTSSFCDSFARMRVFSYRPTVRLDDERISCNTTSAPRSSFRMSRRRLVNGDKKVSHFVGKSQNHPFLPLFTMPDGILAWLT